ncbi:hypothetical protein [Actinoplanes solisilvae]|uniref:hypothetical protein n=1 Tax=Actinoplanes solisilvae TaxID=2486853 RepID=UPI000FDCB6CB|nr:hypothetical protein [Actinoplanes solisilvae]
MPQHAVLTKGDVGFVLQVGGDVACTVSAAPRKTSKSASSSCVIVPPSGRGPAQPSRAAHAAPADRGLELDLVEAALHTGRTTEAAAHATAMQATAGLSPRARLLALAADG